MEKEKFDRLLADGELAVILSQGGANLTHEQLEMVKAVGQVQADDKLREVQRNTDILRGIRMARGARYSDVMNDVAESYQKKFDPDRISKAMSGDSKLKGKTDDKMQEEPEETPYNKRNDPSISKIAPNTHLKIKKGDSEADILAKMLNMMTDNYNAKSKKLSLRDKYLKEQDTEKDKRNEKLLQALGHRKNKAEPKKRDKDLNWFKMAAIAGIAGIGLFGMDKAYASLKELNKLKLPSLKDISDSMSEMIGVDVAKLPEMPGMENLKGHRFKIKGPESIAGGASAEELKDALDIISDLKPNMVANALNDLEHHKEKYNKNGKTDVHVLGIAADLDLGEISKPETEEIQKLLKEKYNISAKLTYEPPDKREGSVNPRGHTHFQLTNPGESYQQPTTQTTKLETPPTKQAPKLQPVPKDYALNKTDEIVKTMQDTKGQKKKPLIYQLNQNNLFTGPTVNVKKGIQDVEERNWQANREIPAHIVKQFGLQ